MKSGVQNSIPVTAGTVTARVQCRLAANAELQCVFFRVENLMHHQLCPTLNLVPASIWSGKRNVDKLSNPESFLTEQDTVCP